MIKTKTYKYKLDLKTLPFPNYEEAEKVIGEYLESQWEGIFIPEESAFCYNKKMNVNFQNKITGFAEALFHINYGAP